MNIKDEAVELKPCPFCASRVLNQFKDDDNHIIECAQCGCEVSHIQHHKVSSCWNRRAPEPAKGGPEVVERLRKWCSETINQWSDEYEPRENWERQVSGAMREWDKATTEIISDYEALRAELTKSRNYWSELYSTANGQRNAAEARNAELVKALEKIIGGKEVPDPLDDGRSTIMTDLDLDEIDQIARAALKGQSNEA